MAEEQEIIEEPEHPGAHHNKVQLEWKAPEFINHERGPKWFMIAGTLLILLIGYAIYSGSATMAIVFVVLAGVYYLTHSQKPKLLKIKITDLGVFVGETYYPYNLINSFWINYHPPFVHHICLRLSDKTRTKIVIQLNLQNPVEVRKTLAKEIPEIEGEQESIMEIIIRLLRL